MSYNVAFIYTREAGGYEGVVTWRSFPSEEAFKKALAETPEEVRKRQRVLEEGISVERCVELVLQTPIACRVAAAVQAATGTDGVVSPSRLSAEMVKVEYAARIS